MRTRSSTFAAIVAVVSPVSVVGAGPIAWLSHPDGLVHAYEVIYVAEGANWNDARQAAESRTYMGANGYLATITSGGESAFVTQLGSQAGSEEYIVVGGYQDRNAPDYSEPGGGWRWVTGEGWGYANWRFDEPSNGGGLEDVLVLEVQKYARTWNDLSAEVACHWYLAEWGPISGTVVPVPGAGALVLFGLCVANGVLRRRGA